LNLLHALTPRQFVDELVEVPGLLKNWGLDVFNPATINKAGDLGCVGVKSGHLREKRSVWAGFTQVASLGFSPGPASLKNCNVKMQILCLGPLLRVDYRIG